MAGSTATKSEFSKFRKSLTPAERTRIFGMGAVIVALHVVGFGLLIGVVAPSQYAMGQDAGGRTLIFGVGLGITAYVLGMRHAFDADHIAAIDNTTRKLMEDGQRPVSVGFWFSLGHSTIVFGLCVLLTIGVRSLVGSVESGSSTLHTVTGLIGPSVSGVFLVILGVLNLVTLIGIVKVFRRMKEGHFDEAALEAKLSNRGGLNRFLGGLTKAVRKPWHIYPVGVLFGLGFDTATEISLLILAGGAAAVALPWYAVLTLPILFTAGMSLWDTMDGCFMNFAYGWAFSKPVRKVFYNMTITSLSVVVALVIGVIELVGVLADRLKIESGPIGAIASINLDYVGFGIVGLFIVMWIGSVAFWKFGNVEERWGANLQNSSAD
ncbi:MAG: HoxN/HupN/NixA family nickel/cobalt transporter [Antricoccus sp.]